MAGISWKVHAALIAAITDTHALIHYATHDFGRLGKKALRVFEAADQRDGNGYIYVPTVALVESFLKIRSKHVQMATRFDHGVRDLNKHAFFEIVPLSHEIVIKASELIQIHEPFDRLITATAAFNDLPLITKDEEITASKLVEIIWDE